MQTVEDSKPRLSKISWLDDVLVYRPSIIPIVLRPVLFITLFAAAVALASAYGHEVALTNNVVPLLSVVVGLLLVFRNSTAYERYAEGRKDFTMLLSNARNLARVIWVNVVPPPAGEGPPMNRDALTERKRELIRLVVGFVFATKHYLRAEGGVHHADLQALLPKSLLESAQGACTPPEEAGGRDILGAQKVMSPRSYSMSAVSVGDEEENIGGSGSSSPRKRAASKSFPASPNKQETPSLWIGGEKKKKPASRRPTAVRVRPVLEVEVNNTGSYLSSSKSTTTLNERTPLIKPGVRPDIRRTNDDVDRQSVAGLGRLVEVGLPLIIAHEISRGLFRFRRQGCLEAIGPAGFNAMQGFVQSMTNQLGSMERIQTPLPYVFCVHLKQCVTLYLLCLPFVLVESLGWKMIPIVTCTAFTLCGVEGIAAQIEQPFGTDPSDLNLDLFCTELLCECEAIIERLPEGDDEDEILFTRSLSQRRIDDEDGE
ncbi:hypothetical protein VHUM_00531 [Vanrija humicola]|uniref:Uncharacterized protein n=1 Tax=Vanrija humicola TaxID=5417 RepID=A0A7D8V6I2_VANHU|nr:hypothetical protein VHUM_00531 [Vanrija humicola]